MGHARVAEWAMALPLTARCLSSLPRYESQSGHMRKLPVILGFRGVFRHFLLHFLQLASHKLSTIWLTCDEKRNYKGFCLFPLFLFLNKIQLSAFNKLTFTSYNRFLVQYCNLLTACGQTILRWIITI